MRVGDAKAERLLYLAFQAVRDLNTGRVIELPRFLESRDVFLRFLWLAGGLGFVARLSGCLASRFGGVLALRGQPQHNLLVGFDGDGRIDLKLNIVGRLCGVFGDVAEAEAVFTDRDWLRAGVGQLNERVVARRGVVVAAIEFGHGERRSICVWLDGLISPERVCGVACGRCGGRREDGCGCERET